MKHRRQVSNVSAHTPRYRGTGSGRDCLEGREHLRRGLLFSIKVAGDSMAPRVRDGDEVCFMTVPKNLVAEGNLRECVEDGKVVLVEYAQERGGGCLMGRLFHEGFGKVRIEKDNPDFGKWSIPLEAAHVAFISVAYELRSKHI